MQIPTLQLALLIGIVALFINGFVLWFVRRPEPPTTGDVIRANAELELKKKPDATSPHYEMAYSHLWDYVSDNRGQNRRIFLLTVMIIIAGFAMIAYGIIDYRYYFTDARFSQTAPLSSPPWPAVIAGLVTEFIAATILFVHQSILKQTDRYVRMLSRLTIIGLSLRILDDLKEDLRGSPQASADWISEKMAEHAKLILQSQLCESAPDESEAAPKTGK